jgi:hypothetical protein
MSTYRDISEGDAEVADAYRKAVDSADAGADEALRAVGSSLEEWGSYLQGESTKRQKEVVRLVNEALARGETPTVHRIPFMGRSEAMRREQEFAGAGGGRGGAK